MPSGMEPTAPSRTSATRFRGPAWLVRFRHLRSLHPDEIVIKPIKLPRSTGWRSRPPTCPGSRAATRSSPRSSAGRRRKRAKSSPCSARTTTSSGTCGGWPDGGSRPTAVRRSSGWPTRTRAARSTAAAASAGRRCFRIGDLDRGVDPALLAVFAEAAHVDCKPVCRNCWARYVCGGGCYYLATLRHGSPLVPDPVDCQLAQCVIELCVATVRRLQECRPNLLESCLLS